MNLPNRITLIRLILIPVFAFFYLADFIPYGKLVATLIFIIACLTDFLDGHIARKRNMVTVLGNFFDTVADKLLVMSGFLLVAGYPVTANGGELLPSPIIFPDYLGIAIAIVVIARELIVMALRSLAASNGVVLKADMFGKVKATFQFVTLIYYFAFAFVVEEFYYAIEGVGNTILSLVGYILLAITVILTILSMCNYLIKNKHVFEEKKAEKKDESVATENNNETNKNVVDAENIVEIEENDDKNVVVIDESNKRE